MSSEIIAAIDKELEGLREALEGRERIRDAEIARRRQEISDYKAKHAEQNKKDHARIAHLERMRKVETGGAKVVVARDGGAE